MDLNIPGFDIDRMIGEGAMATVYLALQRSLERKVALKIMAPALAAKASAEADSASVFSELISDSSLKSCPLALVRPCAISPVRAAITSADLILDGILGIGGAGEVREPAARAVRAVLGSGVPVVAVDVPSGVWGDSGKVGGAPRCDLTVTFFRMKPAHVLMPSRGYCGEVVVADIGIQPDAVPEGVVQAWDNHPDLWRHCWPALGEAGHKYDRGHAVVWGGARMPGAARLSARAAARIGAGLTTLCVPLAAWPVHAAALDSIMVHGVPDDDADAMAEGLTCLLHDARHRAVLVGPGAGAGLGMPGVRALVASALRSQRQVVLDADALTAWGMQLYFWSRWVYLPLYVFGVKQIRSLVWLVSALGLTLMFAAVLF